LPEGALPSGKLLVMGHDHILMHRRGGRFDRGERSWALVGAAATGCWRHGGFHRSRAVETGTIRPDCTATRCSAYTLTSLNAPVGTARMPLHHLQSLLGWTTNSTAAAAFSRCARLAAVLLLAITAGRRVDGAEQPPALGLAPAASGQLRSDESGGWRTRLGSGTFDQRQRAMWELWRDR